MGLLPVYTEFRREKTRLRAKGQVVGAQGALRPLNGQLAEGYEIHMGTSRPEEGAAGFLLKEDGGIDGCAAGNVASAYMHGFFDSDACRAALIAALCAQKGIAVPAEGAAFDFAAYKNSQYDILAAGVRAHLDIPFIYKVLHKEGTKS
jgi:adenosylcobyric acid synthase